MVFGVFNEAIDWLLDLFQTMSTLWGWLTDVNNGLGGVAPVWLLTSAGIAALVIAKLIDIIL